MKKTKNYAMPYPEQDDYFNVEDFQDMMVSVDDLMKKLSDSGAQISSDAEHLYNQTKAQMDNIQKRMNAFTALREGSTTGDAELTDIRVAYDGKEYGNAGEAVREQASDIHKALFGAGASIWSKAKSESTKYVAETKGICILNERFTAAGVVAKISRGTFAQNESTLNLDRECSAYIVEFEKNPGTVYMPSAETIKIVSTTKIIFEVNGNARCWIPVKKGQYLAVDSTATAYTSESNHVPYMLYDQANKTLECRGFDSTGIIEPVDPYSLALEYKLEYDMDDTGLVKQIDANREDVASLKEEISDYAYINYPYPFTQDSSLIGSDNVTKFYTQKMGGIKYLSIVESECNFKEYYVQTFYATSDIAIISIRGNLYDGTTPFYAEYSKPRAEAEKEITFNSEQYPLTKIHAIIDWNKVNAGYGQNLTEESAKIQEQCIVRNSSNIKIYVVDKSGKGDYTKIQDAIDAASDGDIIYVKSGMYEESVVNTKQVTLIGQDKESTVLFNTTGEYNTPPLWTCSGKIENLTVYAWNRDNKNVEEISNLGYAFHLDQKWNANVNDRHIEIKNCIFKSDFGDCIGCGMDAGAKIEISNCICEPTLKSGIKIHPFPTTGTSKILLRNNIFKVGSDSNAYGILFHTGGTDGTNFNTIDVEAYYNIAKTYDGWDNNCFKMNPYNYGNTLAGMNTFTI